MQQVRSWSFCLALLVCCQSVCFGCKWIQGGEYKMKSNFTLTLLRAMVKDVMEIETETAIPEEIFKLHNTSEIDRKIKILQKTSENFVMIFRLAENTTWEETRRQHLLVLLHRQAFELKSCLKPVACPECSQLRTYFRSLKQLLERHGYSAKTWEFLAKQALKVTIRMDLLSAQILSQL
ncbi:interferon a3-like [Polypterus senegalus]|uniref:interferon a3-like n=1 Tax=Polypterus senegalus TaxID=55291 RepID=UPI00196466F6|nr:interferon a3-like [Polypterus senegalus]